MTDESSKTQIARGPDFAATYLQGRVIDIGCGPDLVAPQAEPFDLPDGDAQQIASLRQHAAYDAVHSSHCLEHMSNVPEALWQWWSLVRPGGYLIIVVPDEDLYEQGGWPSLFNREHKATFRLAKKTTWSPVSYDLLTLMSELDGAKIVRYERHDHHYDYSLKKINITRLDRVLFLVQRTVHGLLQRLAVPESVFRKYCLPCFVKLASPIDQTYGGGALAQIQVIAQKADSPSSVGPKEEGG